jgi:hypothetical protein
MAAKKKARKSKPKRRASLTEAKKNLLWKAKPLRERRLIESMVYEFMAASPTERARLMAEPQEETRKRAEKRMAR